MRQRSQGGFTLLELAIVLVIVGLLAVGALKAASALRENAGISETSKRLDTLVTALQTFLVRYNRLPCPADPKLDVNEDQNFGKEARDGNGNCSLPEIPSKDPKVNFYRGVVPGRALGLNGGILLDAWDRQFTYVVIAKATQDNSFTSSDWPANLELLNKAGGNSIQQGIAVIISHGANGGDAYLATSGKRPEEPSQGEDEEANLDNNYTFVQAPYSTNEKNPFDDQVLALTEDQVVQPLANQGALITKRAQALEKLKRIENALIAYMAGDWDVPSNAQECSPNNLPRERKARRRIPFADSTRDGREDRVSNGSVPYKDLSLDESDVHDPWGNPIQYQPDLNAAKLQDCDAGLYTEGTYGKKDVVFKLTSHGPNKDDSKDDIFIKRRKRELLGTLLAAGVQVDYTNSPYFGQQASPNSNL